jgi:hypothetical protein
MILLERGYFHIHCPKCGAMATNFSIGSDKRWSSDEVHNCEGMTYAEIEETKFMDRELSVLDSRLHDKRISDLEKDDIWSKMLKRAEVLYGIH